MLISRVEATLIAELLTPYVEGLSSRQLSQVSTYLDLLLKWNARMNLTSIRDPENIVKRHFGESFFLARHISALAADLMDIGSGAGFPAIPIKIYRPELNVTLVEAQQRKATFLREVGRALNLDVDVKNVRVEDLLRAQPASAAVITFRAVEKFESILPLAAKMIRKQGAESSRGCLAILVSTSQVPRAQSLLPDWRFEPPIPVPGGDNRVLLRGEPK
ncbi:MAG TPA: 16S rRNA (guanine(527)-N(7))-methyltransferase RsmG [Terriglobales bacterium]|nr:16S rRNA (guanine(527)-N(7))-methyltransferase RsmG [Terriglobales bacterium]